MPVLQVGDAELIYEERGPKDGPAVVLLHGTLMDHTMFAAQVEAFAGSHRVVAYDHRGRGTAGSRAPFTLLDLVEDLRQVMDALGIDRAVVGGMSMGGFTALRFAVRYPERLSALVLIDTAAVPHSPEGLAQIEGMLAFAHMQGMTPLVEPVADMLFGATTRRESPDLVRAWQERWMIMDLGGITNEVNSWLRREDFTPCLAEIRVPALVLHGAEDVSLDSALGRALAQGLPAGEFVEIPRAGHTSNVEQPAAVNQAISGFLDRLRQTPVAA